MSVLAIIVIVVVLLAIALALFVFLPRAREKARVKVRERELGKRRDRVVSEQREEAEARGRRAEEAEQRARIAEQEGRRERAEAQLREEQAARHERGMADHELIEDHERDRFAGTSAVSGDQRTQGGDGEGEAAPDADGQAASDADGQAASDADGQGGNGQRTSAYEEGRRSVQDPSRLEDFRQGRKEEEDRDGGGLLDRLPGRKSQEPTGRR